MTSKVSFTIRDYSDEVSTFSLSIPDVTSANYDATLTALGALNVAVAAATKGNIVGVNLIVDTGLAGADTRPTDPYAQREIGARFYYQDDVTGEKQNFTIGAADLDLLAQGGTDDIDLTLSIAANIVTAFEALNVSKSGNPITVNRARVVGRSS